MNIDSFSITFDESNVENTIDDFDVVEQRYTEHTILNLSKEQIIIELTNLLYNEYKQDIGKKVGSYFNLLSGLSNKKAIQSFDPTLSAVRFRQLKYYKDKDHEVDEEYENEHNVKYGRFEDFLLRLREVQTSSESYTAAIVKFGNIMRPFIPLNPNNVIAVANQHDAVWYNNDILTRNITRLLKDDTVEVVGYYNKGNPSDTEYTTFDVQRYMSDLESIAVNDKVDIVFNDFFFHNKKIITTTIGTIKKKNGDNIQVQVHDQILHYDAHFTNFYIYPSHTPKSNIYAKSKLFNSNILFVNVKDKSFLLPCSPSQILYIQNFNNIRNFDDLNTLLKAYHVNINTLSLEFEKIFKYVISKRYTPLVIANKNKPSKPEPDSEYRNVKLQNNIYKDAEFLLNKLKTKLESIKRVLPVTMELESKETQYKMKIKQLTKDSKEQKCDQKLKYIITKIYTSLKDLYDDNDKNVYYDSQYDPTRYDMLRKYAALDAAKTNTRLREDLLDSGVSVKDVEFEIKSITRQKRKVRPGEHCLLATPYAEYVYVRKIVDNVQTWVKVTELPFKVCSDDMIVSNTIENACILDTYDNLCKTVNEAINNNMYNHLKGQLDIINDIKTITRDYQKYVNILDQDINHNKMLQVIKKREDRAIIDTQDHADEADEYEEDATYKDDEFYQDYNDNQHYAVLVNDNENTNITQSTSPDFLTTICQFTGITLNDTDKRYIMSYIEPIYVKHNVDEKVAKERSRAERKNKNQQLYDKKKDYRDRFDQMLNEKMRVYQEELVANMFAEVVVSTIAILSLYILSTYPQTLLKEIYPSCIQYMSYQSYPVNDKDTKKLLSRYLCCLVKHISTANDPRFHKISPLSIDELHSIVVKKIDVILHDDVELNLKININKDNISRRAPGREAEQQHVLQGYKPVSEYGDRMTDKVALYLKAINDMIRKTKHTKISILNVPTLMNSCCSDLLTNDLTYYNLFFQNEDFKRIKQSIMGDKKPTNHIVLPSIKVQTSIKNGQMPVEDYVRFEKDQIKYLNTQYPSRPDKSVSKTIEGFKESVRIFRNDTVILGLVSNHGNDTYWDDVVYGNTLNTMETVVNCIKQNIDTFDNSKLDAFKSTLILLRDLHNVKMVLYSLINYLKSKMRMIISKIISEFKFKEEFLEKNKETKDVQVLVSFLRSSEFPKGLFGHVLEALGHVDDLYMIKEISIESYIKNTSLLGYFITKLFHFILVCASNNSTYIESDIAINNRGSSEHMKLAASLVNYFICDLIDTIMINDVDISIVKKREDESREKKKEELIGLYMVDDDERQLQMTLRKIGMDTWYNVGVDDDKPDQYVDVTNVDIVTNERRAVNITEHRNNMEEEENYIMVYEGENSDRLETDGDYPSQALFYSDRD